MAASSLKLMLDLDELHGWLNVTLVARDKQLKFAASHACDSISNLLDAVSSLIAGESRTCIQWTTERHRYDFLLTAVDESTTLRVYKYPDGLVFSRERDGKVVLRRTDMRLSLARMLLEPLLQLRTMQGYAERWGHAFPTRTLESVMERLKPLE